MASTEIGPPHGVWERAQAPVRWDGQCGSAACLLALRSNVSWLDYFYPAVSSPDISAPFLDCPWNPSHM